MCGIAGMFQPGGLGPEAEHTLIGMRDHLTHRGPDGAGLWLDAAAGIALGHRRLSIIDVSPSGHQPMASPSGRYQIVFNGEVYNHRDLRQRAQDTGHRDWRGHSDTESLLACIDLFGLTRTLQDSVGMFALALWDRENRTLHLARDRMGEKPLFYGWQGDVLLFGSELKALRAHLSFEGVVDHDMLPVYLQYGYIPAPWSVWRGIRKLMPGTTVSISAADPGQLPTAQRYWSLTQVAIRGQQDPFLGSDEDAVKELEHVLGRAVQDQMVADVPLGAFLSGGVDSSTLVALMQARASRSVRTFSIGFEEAAYNEAPHARAIASHLGTDHTELCVTAQDAQAVVPLLPAMFDEPFGDSSAIPTHLVAQLARHHVTVALSGDGGDELFGGYKRYASTTSAYALTRRLPSTIRPSVFGVVDALAGAAVTVGSMPFAPQSLRKRLRVTALRFQLMKDVAASASLADAYSCVLHQWSGGYPATAAGTPRLNPSSDEACSSLDAYHQLMAIDSQAYLPNDILAKVDRASMAVSMETRIPLLDHRVVEFAWRLPLGMKVRHGGGKWVLRQVLARHVPPRLFERPKMGFGVPVGDWLRGPLRSWAEDLLSERALAAGGPLPVAMIRDGWARHLRGDPEWRDRLWTVLMWQAWRASI